MAAAGESGRVEPQPLSPELALVCPELAAAARAALPDRDPDGWLPAGPLAEAVALAVPTAAPRGRWLPRPVAVRPEAAAWRWQPRPLPAPAPAPAREVAEDAPAVAPRAERGPSLLASLRELVVVGAAAVAAIALLTHVLTVLGDSPRPRLVEPAHAQTVSAHAP